jgi:hypothetical protein
VLLELTPSAIVDALQSSSTAGSLDRKNFQFYWDLVEQDPARHRLTGTSEGVCISYETADASFVRDLAFDLVQGGIPLPYCELGSETSRQCKILLPIVSTADGATAYGRSGSREKEIGGSGGSLEPPGPLLTHLHTV